MVSRGVMPFPAKSAAWRCARVFRLPELREIVGRAIVEHDANKTVAWLTERVILLAENLEGVRNAP